MRFKEIGTVSKRVTFPALFWAEFEEDCKANFNNNYSSKINYDHQFRKDMSNIINLLMVDILELKNEVFELKAQLENKPTQEKTKPKTFG